jgi:hypothetical protein
MSRIAMDVSAWLIGCTLTVNVATAQQQHQHGREIPEALQHEHREVQAALRAAMQAPGEVGTAARDLNRVLTPHFQREEQIALPPLGVLRRLVAEPQATLPAWLLPVTDSMRAELPQMLAEHKTIREAVQKLERTATVAGNGKAVQLAEMLARHAQAEEEMYYPMAVLVGEIARKRAGQ